MKAAIKKNEIQMKTKNSKPTKAPVQPVPADQDAEKTAPNQKAGNQQSSEQGGPSPVMLKVAEGIRQAYLSQTSATRDLVSAAVKTGLLLKLAKCLVVHGEFATWCDNQRLGFSRMTRSKYMRLADEFCARAKCKSDLLLAVQLGSDGQPCSYAFDTTRLDALVAEVCQGKSLVELYEDWLTAPAKANAEGPSPAQSKDEPWSDAAFMRLLKGLDRLGSMCSTIPAGKREELRRKLESLVASLIPLTQNN